MQFEKTGSTVNSVGICSAAAVVIAGALTCGGAQAGAAEIDPGAAPSLDTPPTLVTHSVTGSTGTGSEQTNSTPTPEPTGLAALGGVGVAALLRRRRNQTA